MTDAPDEMTTDPRLFSQHHVDMNGRDLNWQTHGWMAGRCPGICDITTSACYCDGKYGHIPPPLGSPPGTPAIKQGRMLGDHCFPTKTPEGDKVGWGNRDYDKIYGESGWCESDHPTYSCGCYVDGFAGDRCTDRYEMHW